MRLVVIQRSLRLLALLVLTGLLDACVGGARTDANLAPVAVPASFDVILVAEKDRQFDYMDVPLTEQDLRAALNYRKEQSLPMSTALLKRGEKAKIKDEHIVMLARIAVALGFTAYVEEDGEINEVRTTVAPKD